MQSGESPEALGVFDRVARPGTPLTTTEVAEELDCARRTAYNKLERLADDGRIETKKVGARGRVWWRPVEAPPVESTDEPAGLEQAQFTELVGAVTDYAIFVLDEDGVVRTWNEGARQLKGYDEDEILGEHFSAFYTDADRDAGRPEENLETAAERGRVEDEGQRVRKDGTRFWANVVITALFDDEDELRGFAKVTRDMTERHEYETQLRAQRDELDELNRINAVIRDIDQALVAATAREEIEQAVCDRLAASSTYTAAWTGEYTDDYGTVTPRAWAGIGEDYLDTIRAGDADDARETERGVGATALRTRTIQPVQRLDRGEDGEPWREASLEEGFESAVAVPLLHDEVEYGILTVYADHESAFDQRKLDVLGELGETISHALAAIRRKERERTLTALQESTRELLKAEDEAGIGDIIVQTLTSDPTLGDAAVYHFDTTENVLRPVSSSFGDGTYAGRLTPLPAGAESPIWTSFMEDEARVTGPVLPSREMGDRRTMVVPLGDHGVLAVAAAEQETFAGDTRHLIQLVAATAEAAFTRLESQANLRERDALLQEQNQRLQRLNEINTLIRGVDQGLVEATTREDVERVVCERLTTSDRFRFAWIGEPDKFEQRLAPRTWSGTGRGYLDSVELSLSGQAGEPEPAITALERDDVAVVSNVAESLRGGQWRKEAFTREFQSVISVPLHYGDVVYGVLSVYADRPNVFEEMERAVFVELGETVANAINAVETGNALLAESVVGLEFRLTEETSSVLYRLASQVGCEITFEGAIPVPDTGARLFFVAHGAPPDELEDALERSVAVESSRVVATREEGQLVEAVVSGSSIVLTLLEYGAALRSLRIEDDGMYLEVDVPSGTDVRSFAERFQHRYESAEFIARQRREAPFRTRRGFYAELEGALTPRQLEVLQTAYYGGFFASPRECTGGDLAEVLGVSQPTVTDHLRSAQGTLLELLLGDRPVAA